MRLGRLGFVLLAICAGACSSSSRPATLTDDAGSESSTGSGGADSGAVAPRDAAGDAKDSDSAAPDSAEDAAARARLAGFRASRYGPSAPFPPPEYWAQVANGMASKLDAAPGGIWILGTIVGGGCDLTFPSPGNSYTDIRFASTDQNEAALNHFDAQGIKVWLQVEPGRADVATLIKLVLDRYRHHTSVIGFGVDVEWLGDSGNPEGRQVTDAEARTWVETMRSYDPKYTLMLKHWLTQQMPPTHREGIFFVDDSQDLGSLMAMTNEFKIWGQTFPDNPVGFQIGYDPDEQWWGQFSDPPAEVGGALINAIGNTYGIFWVDFTIEQIFPR